MLRDFVFAQNAEKTLFTPGPGPLLEENVRGLGPAFGRGDPAYVELESEVMEGVSRLSGQENVVRLQGSASLAIEIMIANFLHGKVLVVSSGYYSQRLVAMAESAKRTWGYISDVVQIGESQISSVDAKFDWVLAAPVETSMGLLVPIDRLKLLSGTVGARLMLDATASIGLEQNHELADAAAFSTCKGLFGLTGGAFVTFSDLQPNQIDSFYLDIRSHQEKKMTGPYHSMMSLHHVLPRIDELVETVRINKKRFLRDFSQEIALPDSSQPMLCTAVLGQVSALDPRAVLYSSRGNGPHSIVCHLGEAHLGSRSRGDILTQIFVGSNSASVEEP